MIDLPGVTTLWKALPEARVVGGAVRDGLLGRAVADVDFASPLRPEAVMDRLGHAGIKCVPTGLDHGTVTAVIGGRGFEITTLRRDIATDGRHAVVAFTDDWRLDASRRDFTINAMSLTADGTVHDYFGGQDDLAVGCVRFVGDPAARISEDYLRILRFFRFFARYAVSRPDEAAVAAIKARREGILRLSPERVWSELKAILRADDPGAALALMDSTGVLQLVLPGADLAAAHSLLGRGAPVDPLLRVAALMGEDVWSFAARLRLSGAEEGWLAALEAANRLTPASSDADLRRALADEEPAVLVARTWLVQDASPGWDSLRGRLSAMARPVYPLQGRDILALGAVPGPLVGNILEEVRLWWLAGGCLADKAACLADARRRLAMPLGDSC